MFNITINRGVLPNAQIVAPAEVVKRAKGSGNTNAALALAVTIPTLHINQTGLHYRQRNVGAGIEFSFDKGTLALTLRQDMLVANTLSACAQRKWIAHENGHARDNQNLMGNIERELRADGWINELFITQVWHPRADFAAVERTTEGAAATIFQDLVKKAVVARDTQAEYQRVQRDILLNCPGPYIYEVVAGDTLWAIAKFFYGNGSQYESIYKYNQALIGNSPNLIRIGAKLEIPKRP